MNITVRLRSCSFARNRSLLVGVVTIVSHASPSIQKAKTSQVAISSVEKRVRPRRTRKTATERKIARNSRCLASIRETQFRARDIRMRCSKRETPDARKQHRWPHSNPAEARRSAASASFAQECRHKSLRNALPPLPRRNSVSLRVPSTRPRPPDLGRFPAPA